SIEGDLAVRLETSGDLRMQLLPGRHELRLLSRIARDQKTLSTQARPAPWPERETWTLKPAPDLRVLELSGAPGVDPSRTQLPAEWQSESAYLVSPGTTLQLTTSRRGRSEGIKSE